jgi:DNA primase
MDAVEEIKSRLSIEDVISEYVQLKRAGRNWKGLSPFTNEKTPSFTVSPEKQIWHDFSSGQGGDMFTFIQQMEGVDFKGALEILSRKAGMDLTQYRSAGTGQGPSKERLYEINELSTKFYQTQFASHKVALDYVLKQRQFSKGTALTWRLGYAPNNGRALVTFLKGRGYSDQEIKQAGVVNRYGGDLFRGRLMIPLADGQGRIVGFTARILEDEPNAPKYINTSSTALYDKSRHVFGLHHAKAAIRKAKYAVLAEGNLDVIASHQAGVHQVVATAGTALTEQHLKALSRLTGDIRLCFDADRAGLQATERAIPIASKAKVSLSIVSIPSGKDPDELIRQNPAAWQQIIEQPQYALDWLMTRYEHLLNIDSAQGKREFSDVLLPVVKAITDPVEQDHYLVAMAEKLGTSKESLQAKMVQSHAISEPARPPKGRTQHVELPPKHVIERAKQQDHFLSLMLLRPELRQYLEIMQPDMFGTEDAKALLVFLQQHSDFSGAGDSRWASLQPLAESVKLLQLQYEELYQGLEPAELEYEAARLQTQLVEAYVKDQKQTIAAKLRQVDHQSSEALLVAAKELDSLLHRVKGGANG